MEKEDLAKDYGENVIINDEEKPQQKAEEEPQVKNVEIEREIEREIQNLPPQQTPAEKKKEYKRKMTQGRLDSLKKAREAKALKRKQQIDAKKEVVKVAPQTQNKTQAPQPVKDQAPQPAKGGDTQLTPTASGIAVNKESEEDRIERIVQARLKERTPAKPKLSPAQEARQAKMDFYEKLMFG